MYYCIISNALNSFSSNIMTYTTPKVHAAYFCNISELPRLTLRLEVGASCINDPGYCHTFSAVFPKSPQAY